jgi:hypothetical protein
VSEGGWGKYKRHALANKPQREGISVLRTDVNPATDTGSIMKGLGLGHAWQACAQVRRTAHKCAVVAARYIDPTPGCGTGARRLRPRSRELAHCPAAASPPRQAALQPFPSKHEMRCAVQHDGGAVDKPATGVKRTALRRRIASLPIFPCRKYAPIGDNRDIEASRFSCLRKSPGRRDADVRRPPPTAPTDHA